MNLASFFSGVAFATFAASAIFFLKFWRASRDSFFLYFMSAFVLLALERLTTLVFDDKCADPVHPMEVGVWVYLIRLAAFFVIFIAIVRKNQSNRLPK